MASPIPTIKPAGPTLTPALPPTAAYTATDVPFAGQTITNTSPTAKDTISLTVRGHFGIMAERSVGGVGWSERM